MPTKIINIFSKLIVIMIIFQTLFIPVSNASFWGDIINVGDEFLEDGSEATQTINEKGLKNLSNQVYNILFSLGVALSVIIGAVLGIKFMCGSVEEQAKIKEALIPYVVGCIVIFGAFGIWKIVVTFLRTI